MLVAHERLPRLALALELPTQEVTVDANFDDPVAVARLIDHTLLKPEARRSDVSRLCEEARSYGFASVCINPFWVELAGELLADSPVRVCTVIGFPLGANATAVKLSEAELALADGASELDMVQNIGALRSGFSAEVETEVAKLAELAHRNGAILKVILETCLLTDEEKARACQIASNARADFVKTSTGFSTGGATVEDVAMMRRIVGNALGVKASGGVRTLPMLREMVLAGANRIGTSSGVQIIQALQSQAGPSSNSQGLDEATAVSPSEKY